MAQRPLAVPLPHQAAQFLRLRRRITRRDIPHHHHTLHRPYPRRHLLHTPLTPMLRRFNAHDLFASPEQNLDRPSPGEPRYHPRQTRLQVRREQVAITHPPRGVAHYHHLDDAIAQHRGPHHLVRQRLQRPGATIDRHVHVLPYPVPNRLPLAVGFGRRLLRLGQSRPLLRLLAALALLRRRHARVVQRRIAAQPSHEGHPLVQLRHQASTSPSISRARSAQRGCPWPGRCSRADNGRARMGMPVPGQQTATAKTIQLWPLAVATRFFVEATASRNQPKPQTLLPRLWARVSSTSKVMTPNNLRRVSMRMPTRWAKSRGAQAERSKKL